MQRKTKEFDKIKSILKKRRLAAISTTKEDIEKKKMHLIYNMPFQQRTIFPKKKERDSKRNKLDNVLLKIRRKRT